MVPDPELGLDRRDQLDRRLGLRLARRSRAAVLRVTRLPKRRPLVREVAIEVDQVGVGPTLRRLTIGVDRLDQPEVDTRRHRCGRQPLEDRHAVVLVAVDDTDHQHDGATGRSSLDCRDRAALDGSPDLDHADGVVDETCQPGQSARRRRGRARGRRGRRCRAGRCSGRRHVGRRGDRGGDRRRRGRRGRRALVVVVAGARRGHERRDGEEGQPAHRPESTAQAMRDGVRRRRVRARPCGCGRGPRSALPRPCRHRSCRSAPPRPRLRRPGRRRRRRRRSPA